MLCRPILLFSNKLSNQLWINGESDHWGESIMMTPIQHLKIKRVKQNKMGRIKSVVLCFFFNIIRVPETHFPTFLSVRMIGGLIYRFLSLSLCSLRMLWPTGHGGRYNLQPTDNGLFYPPCSLWPTEVVPVLCKAQQEGAGQCLDCSRKWQMAMDPGKAQSQDRCHIKLGHSQVQMNSALSYRQIPVFDL